MNTFTSKQFVSSGRDQVKLVGKFRIIMTLSLVALVVGGCSDDASTAKKIQTEITESCIREKRGDAEKCACAGEKISKSMPPEVLKVFSETMSRGGTPEQAWVSLGDKAMMLSAVMMDASMKCGLRIM